MQIDEEIRALEARASELEKQIFQTDRTIAAEALAAQELFRGVFISDGKKFRWEPTGPGGEYVPKEEPLTDADVQAISESLLLLLLVWCAQLCLPLCERLRVSAQLSRIVHFSCVL